MKTKTSIETALRTLRDMSHGRDEAMVAICDLALAGKIDEAQRAAAAVGYAAALAVVGL